MSNYYTTSPSKPHRIDRNLLGIDKDSLTEGMFVTFLKSPWIGCQPITFRVLHVQHYGHHSDVFYDIIAHNRPDLISMYFRCVEELQLPPKQIDDIIKKYTRSKNSKS